VKRKIFLIFLTLVVIFSIFTNTYKASSDKGIYIIPVKGEIGPAVSSFISNHLKKAKETGSQIVIFDINTLGGRVSDALKIQETIKKYRDSFKIYTFVNNKAESAGVMITLLGEKIFMTPDGSLGSAAVIPYNEKTNSAWAGMLKAQAEYSGRRGDIAKGMADYDLVIEGIKEKNKLLNLSASDAQRLGYCDGIVKDINELIKSTGYRGNKVFYAEKDAKIKISELLNNPYISMLLLLFGIAALIIEAFVPSFGIVGTLGILSIILYFLGNIFAGNTGWWALIIFGIGMVFLIIEAMIPGFGIPGISGLLGISVAIVLSARDLQTGLTILLAAWVVVAVTIYILIKYGINSSLLSKIILKTEQKKENGYAVKEEEEMIGKEGISASHLRPSGIGIFDGKRYDVQTDGEFIMKNKRIVVYRIEGSKIFVKEKGDK
jgi:membrane-bound serine protease (ClpP class)